MNYPTRLSSILYTTAELARAIHTAPGDAAGGAERRMQSMRALFRENNVYRWTAPDWGMVSEFPRHKSTIHTSRCRFPWS